MKPTSLLIVILLILIVYVSWQERTTKADNGSKWSCFDTVTPKKGPVRICERQLNQRETM